MTSQNSRVTDSMSDIATTSLRKKLLKNNLMLLLLAFGIVGYLVYFSLTRISSGFSEVNGERSKQFSSDIEKLSSVNQAKIKMLIENGLKNKGQSLIEKDALSLVPLFEENGFLLLRDFIQKTFNNDPEMVLASFFVVENNQIQAWQYVSRQYPSGLSIPIEYKKKNTEWTAAGAPGRGGSGGVSVADPEILKVINTSEPLVTLKELELYDLEGRLRKQIVYDCTVPVLRKGAKKQDVINARKSGAPVGYLRYVLTLARMEQTLSEERNALQKILSNIEDMSRQAELRAVDVSRRTMRGVSFILFLGFGSVLGLAYFLSMVSSRRIVGPISRLTDIARDMARGNYRVDVDVVTDDEVGVLANAFSDMSTAIMKRDEELAAINRNLEKLVEQRTSELKIQLRNIAGLLNNMKQAVFSVSQDGFIVDPVSRFSSTVFASQIAGKTIFESVFKDVHVNSEAYQGVKTAMAIVFGEGELQWDLMVDQFPTLVPYRVDDEERKIKISYNPLYDGEGRVERILFVAEDVTAVMALEEEKKRNSRQIQRIEELARIGSDQFKDYYQSNFRLIEDTRVRLVANGPKLEEDFGVILRNLHTMKGNSRMFGLRLIAQSIHEIESEAVELRSQLQDQDVSKVCEGLQAKLSAIETGLYEYCAVGYRYLKFENHFDKRVLWLISENLASIESLLSMPESPDVRTKLKHQGEDLLQRWRLLHEQDCPEALEAFRTALNNDSPFQNLMPMFRLGAEAVRIALIREHTLNPLNYDLAKWVPIFLGVTKAAIAVQNLGKSGADSQRVVAAQEIDQLRTRVVDLGLVGMAQILDHMSAILASKEADAASLKELSAYFVKLWAYLAVVSQLNVSMIGMNEKFMAFCDLLDSMPEGFKDCQARLDQVQLKQCILLATLRALCRTNNHPQEFFVAAQSFGIPSVDRARVWVGDGQVDVVQHWSELFSDALPVEQMETLFDKSKGVVGPVALAVRRLFEAAGSSIHWKFAQAFDVTRLMNGACETRQGKMESTHWGTMEVVDSYFNSVKQLVADYQRNARPVNPNELFASVHKLLELPLRPALARFRTMIEDLAERLKKKVEFRISGDDITLHRDSLYLLNDALVHLLRNCLDHGLETPDERKQLGKPEQGLLEIHCQGDGGRTQIIVSDDGRGIDPEVMVVKGIEKGILSEGQARRLSHDEKLGLIFLPGFTTREKVSELSGRGVGMDVAKANIEKISGTIVVQSEVGKGTQFAISLQSKVEF